MSYLPTRIRRTDLIARSHYNEGFTELEADKSTTRHSYVGILHEINSETSTVALEQVVSHGTEGRRNDPSQEIAGSDNVYEYIVFRGSDVKDLRIEEQPKPQPPPQLDDPAILGVCNFCPPHCWV